MKSLFTRRFLSGLGLTLLAVATPAWSGGPSVSFMLGGKPVTAVPVDKLGDVSVTVSTGGQSFKQVFAGQWGNSLDQSLNVVGTRYKRSAGAPDLARSDEWNGYGLGLTSRDSGWSGKNSLSESLRQVGSSDGIELYRADTNDDVIVTGRFRRKVYTGKKIWVDNGWVDETRWETVGPTLGKATLKLDPPTFAGSLDVNALFAPALQKFNAPPPGKYDDNKAMLMSRTLLYPESYGGREVDFKGSELKAVENAAGTPAYSWNYDHASGAQMVYARFPAKLKVHAVINTKFEGMPAAMKTEADFDCTMDAVVTRKLGSSSWEVNDLEINDDFREHCQTTDGKSPDDIVKTITPMGNATSAEDLMKGFGF
ncbi:MAG TPA: hypothetical protein V6D23_18625 [Candidatus Obscuribacterales bacterium]